MCNLTSLVHRDLLLGILETGTTPPFESIAATLDASVDTIRAAAHDLETAHALVFYPGTEEIWVIPPLSLVPTAFFVQGPERGWWASCIWCALGVASLVDDPAVRIHTRLAGETEEVVIDPTSSTVTPPGLVAHFPIPIARAWDNVHRFCGSTLVFASPDDVPAWCSRHGIPRGDIQPLDRVRELAHRWYGDHLDPAWRKWTLDEARTIFDSVGLTGETWALPTGDGAF